LATLPLFTTVWAFPVKLIVRFYQAVKMYLSEKITEETSNTIVSSSVATIIGSIPLVLLWGFPDIGNQLASLSLTMFSTKQLLTLLYILFVAVLLLLTWIRSYRKKINELTELTPEGGIYRDIKGNAYCPIDKFLMSPYNQKKEHYFCHSCNKSYSVEYKNELIDTFSM
jgi:hypothetical protein